MSPDRKTQRAAKDQAVSYILLDYKPFHHADYESAVKERDFVAKKTGKNIRIMRVLNIAGTRVHKVVKAIAKLDERDAA